jgi:hypothetical protein
VIGAQNNGTGQWPQNTKRWDKLDRVAFAKEKRTHRPEETEKEKQ